MKKIVAAACHFPDSQITLIGMRHWSRDMYWNAGYSVDTHTIWDIERAKLFFTFKGTTETSNPELKIAKDHEQGFVTQDFEFVSREEGWQIAREAGQIIHRVRGRT